MHTDPISDMLTRIRNAAAASKKQAEIPFSKLKMAIAKILKAEKFITEAKESGKGSNKVIVIDLMYKQGKSVITRLTRISTPSRRVYGKKEELPYVLNVYGIAIISTPAGLMTNKQARRKGLGGEIICEIY